MTVFWSRVTYINLFLLCFELFVLTFIKHFLNVIILIIISNIIIYVNIMWT